MRCFGSGWGAETTLAFVKTALQTTSNQTAAILDALAMDVTDDDPLEGRRLLTPHACEMAHLWEVDTTDGSLAALLVGAAGGGQSAAAGVVRGLS